MNEGFVEHVLFESSSDLSAADLIKVELRGMIPLDGGYVSFERRQKTLAVSVCRIHVINDLRENKSEYF
ncbi:hypothetical protein T265_09331 [Opisthorchis viverrini]|uniref:Uncharacterized protein n=1 Tax=Opisthorchis viverrini TaxID=6198 RepID=A0A075A5E6_OPIVI|nr:hypothetical protein T265_09331 [Opisthorchis viverrini]KER22629.1 hypothetical protein T265_09331 [Opisthorchis viverrini]